MRPIPKLLLLMFAVLAMLSTYLALPVEACHGVQLIQPIQAIGVQHVQAVQVQAVAVPVRQQVIRQRVIQRRPIIQRQRIVQRVRGFCENSETLKQVQHLADTKRESVDLSKFARSQRNEPVIRPTAELAASP